MTQNKLIILALAVTIIAAMAFQNLVATRRLAKAQEVAADLRLKLEVSEQTKLAEREAYQKAMNLVASVRESEQRLISLSNAINSGIANLGADHAEVDPCFYSIPDPATIDGLFRIPNLSTP